MPFKQSFLPDHRRWRKLSMTAIDSKIPVTDLVSFGTLFHTVELLSQRTLFLLCETMRRLKLDRKDCMMFLTEVLP